MQAVAVERRQRLGRHAGQGPGHKRAHARGDADKACREAGACLRRGVAARGAQAVSRPTACFLGGGVRYCLGLVLRQGLQRADLQAQMQRVAKGFDLREQLLSQLAARAHRDAGDVVNGLVGVELYGLTAGKGQGVDDGAAHAQEAELKRREQAHGPGAHDQGIDRNGLVIGMVRRRRNGERLHAPSMRASPQARWRRGHRPS